MNTIKQSRFADELYGDTTALRRAFSDVQRAFGPYVYLSVENGDDALQTDKRIAAMAKDGYAGVIPHYPSEGISRPFETGYASAMAAVYTACAAHGLKSAYMDDPVVMAAYLETHPEETEALECRVLCDYEHECVAGETFHRTFAMEGKLLSLMAVEVDTAETLDLRAYLGEDGTFHWVVPEGNWMLHRYVCERDSQSHIIDMMNYDACIRYFTGSCRTLLDSLSEESRASVRTLICRNVQYGGKNRRMWSENFNEVFREKFGYDPAPYYPCLFQDVGVSSRHYRAQLMSCRAAMLSDGYMKAAADFAAARDMSVTGFAIESKATACSWLFGDGQGIHRHSTMPGISMPFAYLYGMNGIKVAAGASDGTDRGLVSADMFRRYEGLTEDVLYRETLNAFGRGVNVLFTHLGETEPETREETPAIPFLSNLLSHGHTVRDYSDFCARSSLLLRGGRHVCDVAVLYPIHAVHARTYLYAFAQEDGFEYPAVLENADYMNVMNNLLTYGGMDGEFLHPDVLTEDCYAENGLLYRGSGRSRYSVVILPGTDMISIRALRMLAKFFDEGGHILATGCLPEVAFELEECGSPADTAPTRFDEEVRALCAHIFGEAAIDPLVIREIYSSTSEKGGMACFIPAISTAVDGTDMVPAADMMNILNSFGLSRDVIFRRPPKIEYSGVVAYDLPTFLKVGVDVKLAKSGSLGVLHRTTELGEVYCLTNTTSEPYENEVLLRGRHTVEAWEPYKGKVRRLNGEHVRYQEEVYTVVRAEIPASSQLFFVCPPLKEPIKPTSDEELREYYIPRWG